MSLRSFYRGPFLRRKIDGRTTFQLCALSSESSGSSQTRFNFSPRTASPDTITVTKLIEKVFPKHRLKFPETDKTQAMNKSYSELTPQKEGDRLHLWIKRSLEELRDVEDTGEELLEKEYGGNPVDCRQFLQFWHDHSEAFDSYECERSVSCSDLHITGRVDFLGLKKDRTGTLIDWKRTSHPLDRDSIETDKFANPPLEDLPATPFFLYAIRMNLYRHLIEQETGIVINSMQLVRFHPTISEYEITQVVPMPSEVQRLLACRRKEVAQYDEKNNIEFFHVQKSAERKNALRVSRGERDDDSNEISSNSKKVEWIFLHVDKDW